MNKAELISAVANKTNVQVKQTEDTINAVFEVITEVDDGYLKAVEIISNDELFEEFQITDY